MGDELWDSEAAKRLAREIIARTQHGKKSSRPFKTTSRITREMFAAIAKQFQLEQNILPIGRPPTVRGVKTRAVRLDQETEDILTKIAKEWECNHSEAIRRIIRNYDGTRRKSKKSPAAVH